jgi:diaminobutyrate-2-oxoglutarate transaminase
MAPAVCAQAFDRRMLLETSGPESEVVKLLPPLTTTPNELTQGLDIIASSVDAVLV